MARRLDGGTRMKRFHRAFFAACVVAASGAAAAPAGGSFRDYSCASAQISVTPSASVGQRINVQWMAPNATPSFVVVRVDVFEQGAGGSQFFPLALDAVRPTDVSNPQYLAITSLDGVGPFGPVPAPMFNKVSDANALALDKAQYFTSDFPIGGSASFGLRVDRLRGDLVVVEVRYLCDYGIGTREYVQPFPVRVPQ